MTGRYHAHDHSTASSFTSDGLTCQWCSVRLPAGETRCPTCGSPGVPDPNVEVPEPFEPQAELHEWWLDDDEVAYQERRAAMSSSASEDRLLRTSAILIGTGAVFALAGWLVGPVFLSPAMESLTGTPVENASDVRPMGGILGLLFGLFLGAGYGWIAAAER